MWQQAGRAGRAFGRARSRCWWRRTTRSTSTWSPHPADLFDKPSEAAVIDPTNPYVLIPTCCARRASSRSRTRRSRPTGRRPPKRSSGLGRRGELRRRGSLLHHARSRAAPPESRHPQHRRAAVPDRDRGDGRAARHGRRLPRLLAGASRRDLPAPGRAVRGAGAGPRGGRRGRDAFGPRLLHAVARHHRHRGRDRAGAPAALRRHRDVLRDRSA